MTEPTPPPTWMAVILAAIPLLAAGVKGAWGFITRKQRLLERQLKEEQRDHRRTLRAYVSLLKKYERMRGDDSVPPPI